MTTVFRGFCVEASRHLTTNVVAILATHQISENVEELNTSHVAHIRSNRNINQPNHADPVKNFYIK